MSEQVIRFESGNTTQLLDSGEMMQVESPASRSLRERAEDIFEKNYLGPEQIKDVFNTVIGENIPRIPFTEDQLSEASLAGYRLILRIGKTNNVTPITMNWQEKQTRLKIESLKPKSQWGEEKIEILHLCFESSFRGGMNNQGSIISLTI